VRIELKPFSKEFNKGVKVIDDKLVNDVPPKNRDISPDLLAVLV